MIFARHGELILVFSSGSWAMSDEKEKRPSWDTPESEVTNRIFTAANVVSFIRLCMVPVYLVLLLDGHDILATFIFALAASTDFIDGQLARRTHTVSRLGRLLDPAVGACRYGLWRL